MKHGGLLHCRFSLSQTKSRLSENLQCKSPPFFTEWCDLFFFENVFLRTTLVCTLSTGCVIEEKTVYWGHDIKGAGSHNVKVKNQQACATLAATIEGALFWTYRPKDKKCFVKNSKEGRRAHAGRVSGSVACGKCTCDTFIDQW